MAETSGSERWKPPRRLLLLSMPRTASSLLVKILGLKDRPNVITSKNESYLFIQVKVAMFQAGVSGKHIDHWTTDEMDQVQQVYDKCLEDLDTLVQAAESSGDTIFAKEHVEHFFDPIARSKFLHPSSPVANNLSWKLQLPPGIALSENAMEKNTFTSGTFLPDAFLRTWLPIFLIRHPALAFPSYYRVRQNMDTHSITGTETEIRQSLLASMTYSWTRRLYDWYSMQDTTGKTVEPEVKDDDSVPWPIILDSDDYETDPESLVRLSEIIQLDPSKLQFSWEPVSDEGRKEFIPRMVTMQSTLLDSNSVIVRKTSSQDIDIAEEGRKWRKDFGEAVGAQLEQVVRDAMPDYEYLRSKRLMLSSA